MKSLQDLIKNNELKDFPRERTKWKFYPSEASFINKRGTVIGKCLRECWYKWMQYPATNDLSKHIINTIIWGIGIEAHLIRQFKKNDILVTSQAAYKATIAKDAILSMRLDAIIKYGKTEPCVEIKSYEGEPKYILTRPKEPHLLQSFLYLVTYKPRLPYIIVYYRQRPGHRFQETKDIQHRIDCIKIDNNIYPVINGEVSKDIDYKGIIKRYLKLKDYIEKKQLPPRDFSGKAKPCSWCCYRNQCKGEAD